MSLPRRFRAISRSRRRFEALQIQVRLRTPDAHSEEARQESGCVRWVQPPEEEMRVRPPDADDRPDWTPARYGTEAIPSQDHRGFQRRLQQSILARDDVGVRTTRCVLLRPEEA